jgi:hypothetical protein
MLAGAWRGRASGGRDESEGGVKTKQVSATGAGAVRSGAGECRGIRRRRVSWVR